MSHTPSETKAARPYHHGDLKRVLLDQSITLIETEGIDALTLRRLATIAGVSRTAPYRHFKDKDALLAAISIAGFETLNERLQTVADADASDVEARMVAQGVAYVTFACTRPAQFQLMFGRDPGSLRQHLPVQVAGMASFQTIVGSIEWLRTQGATGIDDPWQVAIAAWTMIHGLATLVVNGLIPVGEADPELIAQHVRRNSRLFLRGLMPESTD